jgi:hypothetical protein
LEDSIYATIFSNLSIAASKEISIVIGSTFGMRKFGTLNGGKRKANNFRNWRLAAKTADCYADFTTPQVII